MITIKCLSEKKADVNYTLLVGKTYTVGRKGGDISFPDDQSVSRNHAEISVEHPMANVSDPLLVPIVVLTDLGSKFGTFANEGISNMSTLSMREPMNLTAGDKFRFGRQWNVFEIHYTPLVITTSTIKDVAKLKKLIMTLGGHMVAEWNSKCDFVVMDSLTLTVKAVCALLSGKHIVHPSYFDDLYECVLTGKRKPDPTKFLPPLGERSLEASGLSFDPNPERKKLFEGKTFLFASQKQFNKLKEAIKCGGGKCELISDVMSSRPARMKDPNYIMLSPGVEPGMLSSRIREGIETYRRARKRLVLDSEIGLAAVYNSTEKHCNPSFVISIRNERNTIPQRLGSQTQQPNTSSQINSEVARDSQVSNSSSSVPEIPRHSREAKISQTVKAELPEEDDDDIVISDVVPSGSSRSLRTRRNGNEHETTSASSKKRPADDCVAKDTETEINVHSSTKRIRTEAASVGHDDEDEQSQRALSNIFGLSSDEDEGNSELIVSRIPETQQDTSQHDDSIEIVTPSIRTQQPSPDLFEISDSEDTNSYVKQPSTSERVTRSSKTNSPAKQAATTSGTQRTNNEPSTSNNKRKTRSSDEPIKKPDEESNTKRRKVSKEDDDGNDNLENKIEELNINQTPVIKKEKDNEEEAEEDIIDIPVIVMPLLKKNLNRPTMTVSADGRTIKNFKRFQKVLSSSQNPDVSVIDDQPQNRTINPVLKLTFVPYEDPSENEEPFVRNSLDHNVVEVAEGEEPVYSHEDENGRETDPEDEPEQPRTRRGLRSAAAANNNNNYNNSNSRSRRAITSVADTIVPALQSSQTAADNEMWDFQME